MLPIQQRLRFASGPSNPRSRNGGGDDSDDDNGGGGEERPLALVVKSNENSRDSFRKKKKGIPKRIIFSAPPSQYEAEGNYMDLIVLNDWINFILWDAVEMQKGTSDEDGIRTHACRAHWISSPTP